MWKQRWKWHVSIVKIKTVNGKLIKSEKINNSAVHTVYNYKPLVNQGPTKLSRTQLCEYYGATEQVDTPCILVVLSPFAKVMGIWEKCWIFLGWCWQNEQWSKT